MRNKSLYSHEISLAKGQALQAGNRFTMRVEGDHTVLDLGDLAGEYKLA
jgi:hypothetical protein